ncbi:MAG: hypothetical protein ABSG57_13545 [Candidatus Bathyarchaeia archaeon]
MIASRDWKDLAANPEAFGEAEKKIYSTLEPILCELLDELKTNNRIETVYVNAELDDLRVVVHSLEDCGRSYNLILNATDSHEKAMNFTQALTPFGFDNVSAFNLLIQVGVLGTILSTEMFRTTLLFHSKGLKPTATIGELLRELQNDDGAPKAVAKLRPYLDLNFRNAVAHGMFGLQGDKIVLYKNAKFEILEKLTFADFMIRSKKQSVLTHCLINVIVEKKRAGFFMEGT